MNSQNKFTKLTLEQQDRKLTWEVPYEDVSVTEICEALYGILIGMTFAPETVAKGMKNFLEENGFSEEN